MSTWKRRSPSSSLSFGWISGLDRFQGLRGLLQQVRAQRVVSLHAVPGAAVGAAEGGDDPAQAGELAH